MAAAASAAEVPMVQHSTPARRDPALPASQWINTASASPYVAPTTNSAPAQADWGDVPWEQPLEAALARVQAAAENVHFPHVRQRPVDASQRRSSVPTAAMRAERRRREASAHDHRQYEDYDPHAGAAPPHGRRRSGTSRRRTSSTSTANGNAKWSKTFKDSATGMYHCPMCPARFDKANSLKYHYDDKHAGDVGELREQVAQQGHEISSLRRRVDRLEKSTHLVIENGSRLEELFSKAEASREFKNLASDAAASILRELSVLTRLPMPLREVPPESWHASNNEHADICIDATVSWWGWAPALLSATRFVAPNKTRSRKDETTGEWRRAPGHFVLRLEFGEASLPVQQGLQGALGQWIGKAVKAVRETGEASFNLYLDKTPEELERKRKRAGLDMGTSST
ncbi:unnamed protein product, partial [Symbiodinium sp. CCMP2592]